MASNFEENFPYNAKADGFCIRKGLFAAFNEKAELRLFKRL